VPCVLCGEFKQPQLMAHDCGVTRFVYAPEASGSLSMSLSLPAL
jgi:hypothetical protein